MTKLKDETSKGFAVQQGVCFRQYCFGSFTSLQTNPHLKAHREIMQNWEHNRAA